MNTSLYTNSVVFPPIAPEKSNDTNGRKETKTAMEENKRKIIIITSEPLLVL